MIVRRMHAFESETVLIDWTLLDGSHYEQKVTVPPPSVRDARAVDAPPQTAQLRVTGEK